MTKSQYESESVCCVLRSLLESCKSSDRNGVKHVKETPPADIICRPLATTSFLDLLATLLFIEKVSRDESTTGSTRSALRHEPQPDLHHAFTYRASQCSLYYVAVVSFSSKGKAPEYRRSKIPINSSTSLVQ